MLALRVETPAAWAECVCADFDAFLVDHAACERKAAATGMAFVVRYPDRTELLEPLIGFAREELEHFHRVYRLIAARGLRLGSDRRDVYVAALLDCVRPGRDLRLLDRLLVAGIVEARGCERFRLLADTLRDPMLCDFYHELARSEARHQGLFLRLARSYFSEQEVARRLDQLLDVEGAVLRDLPIRPALHG